MDRIESTRNQIALLMTSVRLCVLIAGWKKESAADAIDVFLFAQTHSIADHNDKKTDSSEM